MSAWVVAVVIVVILLIQYESFTDKKIHNATKLSALVKGSDDVTFSSCKKVYPEINVVEYYKMRNITCDDLCIDKIASVLD